MPRFSILNRGFDRQQFGGQTTDFAVSLATAGVDKLQGTNLAAAVAHRNYQRAIFDADARMPLDALADNIASLKLTHWRRCRAPLVKILALVNFSCPSLTVGSPEAPVSRGSCHGMFAAPFIAPS